MFTLYDCVAGIIGLSCECFSSEWMWLVRMLYGCFIYLFIFVCYVFKYWMNSLSCLNIALWLLHVLNCSNAVQTLAVLRECCVVPTVWTLSKLYWPLLRRRNTALHEFVWYQCVFLLLRCNFLVWHEWFMSSSCCRVDNRRLEHLCSPPPLSLHLFIHSDSFSPCSLFLSLPLSSLRSEQRLG